MLDDFLNFSSKTWQEIVVGNQILISNVETGITCFEVIAIVNRTSSSTIYRLKSLSDERDMNYLAHNNSHVLIK